jgi:hypothetical protein
MRRAPTTDVRAPTSPATAASRTASTTRSHGAAPPAELLKRGDCDMTRRSQPICRYRAATSAAGATGGDERDDIAPGCLESAPARQPCEILVRWTWWHSDGQSVHIIGHAIHARLESTINEPACKAYTRNKARIRCAHQLQGANSSDLSPSTGMSLTSSLRHTCASRLRARQD